MQDSFNVRSQLSVNQSIYDYYNLPALAKAGVGDLSRLPFSLKILLENQLRHEDGHTVTQDDIKAFAEWLEHKTSNHEIAYHPARVLMQDFTGVPGVVDLAAMRDAMTALGGNPNQINPKIPVDLVIDHSVQVDDFGNSKAFSTNVDMELHRNFERYRFLRWGQEVFENFRVVPPGTGICHQVNLEYLAKAVWSKTIDGQSFAFPDTLVGTDSHTTMINGLGVLGFGVGGIEAEAAILGQPISMRIPDVIGVRLEGELKEGITATDLVLTITEMLRAKGVVGKFVEFYGPGLVKLPVADRATIANMSPEYGATCGFFPIDQATIDYLQLTSRAPETIELVKAYSKAQGLWHDEQSPEPIFTDTLHLDLKQVEPSLAGPKRPQDRVPLSKLREVSEQVLIAANKKAELDREFSADGMSLHHGDVVIAAITSCTNTSNPKVMLAAGLVAKAAVEKGLKPKPWVKSSLAPGSKVVTDYLDQADLTRYLEALGFYLVGYGCTTCIGNSGPLPEAVADCINKNDLVVSAVLSGNRNFEGRIHPQVKANWLASPPLVVAYALAGTTRINLAKEALGEDQEGNKIYLKDLWPSRDDIAKATLKIKQTLFKKEYSEVFQGDEDWQAITITSNNTYQWETDSTYVKSPPFFSDMKSTPPEIHDIKGARILALLGDSITTDHISPAGSIQADSPAGQYLIDHDIAEKDFNSYGSRRGNHEVMMRGTFANIRIRNEMLPGVEGGYSKHFPDETQMPIYDVAMQYQKEQTPLVVIAGAEYGTGSSRDWAAKGTLLLGVKAVIAESFERIHRSNLIGMGVLPLEFEAGVTRKTLGLDGSEIIDITGLENDLTPNMLLTFNMTRANGESHSISVKSRIDTQDELAYYRHGGILQYVLRKMLN